MGTVMMAHVDELCGTAHAAECGFHHIIGRAHKRYHSAVGGFAGVYIKEFHTFHRLYGIGDGFDYILIAPFAEIGHTLYNSRIHGHEMIVKNDGSEATM